jgi:hypothetical protein
MIFPENSLIERSLYFRDPAIVAILLKHPKVARWLSFVNPEDVLKLNVTKNMVRMVLPPTYLDEFVQRRSILRQHGYQCELWLKGKRGRLHCVVDSRFTTWGDRAKRKVNSPRSRTMQTRNAHPSMSRWIEQGGDSRRIEIGNLSETRSISIHGVEDGYPYKFVQPHMGIEEVLNKPIVDLIGQPIGTVDSVISEATQWAIDRAIRTGGTAWASYKFFWQSPWEFLDKGYWRKLVKATYLPGVDEVLVEKISPQSDFKEDQRLWQQFLFEVH